MSSTLRFELGREPLGQTYRDLILTLRVLGGRASLVIRDEVALDDAALRKLKALEGWRRSIVRCEDWPGVEQRGASAQILTYALDADSARALAELVPGLFSWQQPGAPEDLTLLRMDGSPLLTTLAREHSAFVDLYENELRIVDAAGHWSELVRALAIVETTST